MVNQLVDTIKLTGNDSINFVNSLFNPTDEEIYHHNRLIDQIDNDIKVTENQDGFEAEIDGLDLSFIDKHRSFYQITIDITLEIKFTESLGWQNERSYTYVNKNDGQYSEVKEVYYLPCAA